MKQTKCALYFTCHFVVYCFSMFSFQSQKSKMAKFRVIKLLENWMIYTIFALVMLI